MFWPKICSACPGWNHAEVRAPDRSQAALQKMPGVLRIEQYLPVVSLQKEKLQRVRGGEDDCRKSHWFQGKFLLVYFSKLLASLSRDHAGCFDNAVWNCIFQGLTDVGLF